MDRFKRELEQLAQEDALRRFSVFEPEDSVLRGLYNDKKVVNFSSNSYLGLDSHPVVLAAAAAAASRYPAGSGASRLITGNHPLAAALERDIAVWKGGGKALLFSSGYQANVGVISAVADRETDLFLDKLNHASIVDGAVLSRAKIIRYPHNDWQKLETLLNRSTAAKKVVVTDTIFSMDGDMAPLVEIAGLCRRFGALLIVDEAHGCGVYGPQGRGVAALLGVESAVDIVIGTLSKAFGSVGAYAAASPVIIDFLVNKARSMIFNTALPPVTLAASRAALSVAVSAEGDQLRTKLFSHVRALSQVLPAAKGPIIPLLTGTNEKALTLQTLLLKKGLLGHAIRPPTVPAGAARIRLTLSAGHTVEEVSLLGSVLESFGMDNVKGL